MKEKKPVDWEIKDPPPPQIRSEQTTPPENNK